MNHTAYHTAKTIITIENHRGLLFKKNAVLFTWLWNLDFAFFFECPVRINIKNHVQHIITVHQITINTTISHTITMGMHSQPAETRTISIMIPQLAVIIITMLCRRPHKPRRTCIIRMKSIVETHTTMPPITIISNSVIGDPKSFTFTQLNTYKLKKMTIGPAELLSPK